jgi:hypothetical protein
MGAVPDDHCYVAESAESAGEEGDRLDEGVGVEGRYVGVFVCDAYV